mgnify:CR=1 FL=1
MKKDGMTYMYGGSAKTTKRYAKYGKEFKDVPASNPGLAKLPKEVRNKMGYAKKGGMGMGMKKYMYNGQSVPGMYTNSMEELEEMQRGGCFNSKNCQIGKKSRSPKKRARQAKRARRRG